MKFDFDNGALGKIPSYVYVVFSALFVLDFLYTAGKMVGQLLYKLH